jgi:hypothetical protein
MGGFRRGIFENAPRKILLENLICKPLLQAVIASGMPTMLLFTHTAYIGAHFALIHEFEVRV